jgi:rhodanese-related sulfurtransferase
MSANTTISIDKLLRLVGTPGCPAIIDVRTDEDFQKDPRLIPSAVRRPHIAVAEWAEQFKGKSAVVVCEDSARARR